MLGILGFSVSTDLYKIHLILYLSAFMTWCVSGSKLFCKLDLALNWNCIEFFFSDNISWNMLCSISCGHSFGRACDTLFFASPFTFNLRESFGVFHEQK